MKELKAIISDIDGCLLKLPGISKGKEYADNASLLYDNMVALIRYHKDACKVTEFSHLMQDYSQIWNELFVNGGILKFRKRKVIDEYVVSAYALTKNAQKEDLYIDFMPDKTNINSPTLEYIKKLKGSSDKPAPKNDITALKPRLRLPKNDPDQFIEGLKLLYLDSPPTDKTTIAYLAKALSKKGLMKLAYEANKQRFYDLFKHAFGEKYTGSRQRFCEVYESVTKSEVYDKDKFKSCLQSIDNLLKSSKSCK